MKTSMKTSQGKHFEVISEKVPSYRFPRRTIRLYLSLFCPGTIRGKLLILANIPISQQDLTGTA